jgi:L-lactate dehydrogenase (cytochrome)
MLARRGEVQAARAAFDHGVPFCLSTVSLCSIEEVAGATSKPLWFQLYVIRDRGFMRELLSRAAAAGCTTLVFTVDMPVPGVRYRDAKSGLSGKHAGWRRAWQAVTHPSWAWDVGLRGRPHNLGNLAAVLGESSGMEDYMGWLGRNFDPTVTWADLGWIRENWAGQLIIKGILDPGDAREAVRLQADGIVVSNHGGRQLDGVISTAAALPEIAEAVQRDLTILVDGGVRSGSDVVKLLCLGAQGVLLGRAWAFALAACGGIGVGRLLAGLSAQMRTTMALAGATRIDQLDGTFLQYGRSSSPEGGADRFTRRSR